MADAPSSIASSVAGAPLQARDTLNAGEARRAGQYHATIRQAQSVTDADAMVETTDANARVFSDAEGSGSQGREFGDQDEDRPERDGKKKTSGISTDPDGQLHLDLEA